MTTTVDVRPEPFDGAAARRLLAALDRELDDRYAGADDIPPPVLRAAEFAPPRGAFVVAWEDTAPGPEAVGCGGLRPGPAPGTAEVKRMYVVPRARGRRIAELVQHALGDATTAATPASSWRQAPSSRRRCGCTSGSAGARSRPKQRVSGLAA